MQLANIIWQLAIPSNCGRRALGKYSTATTPFLNCQTAADSNRVQRLANVLHHIYSYLETNFLASEMCLLCSPGRAISLANYWSKKQVPECGNQYVVNCNSSFHGQWRREVRRAVSVSQLQKQPSDPFGSN